jgi:peptide/nickel transport system substrate-binding protein
MARSNNARISRRQLIKTVGGTSIAAGLAGCGQGNGDGNGNGNGNLGERVPPLAIMYLPNFGAWADIVPIIQGNIEDAIDHPVELEPGELSGFLSSVYNDDRSFHISTWGVPPAPDQLDPGSYMRRQAIDRAGADGSPNLASYANCDYSELVIEQATTGDPDERRGQLQEAMEIYSQDRAEVPLIPRNNYSSIRTDLVDPGGVGEMGPYQYNTNFFAETTPEEGDGWVWVSQDDWLASTNPLTRTGQSQIGYWSTLVYGTLLSFNSDWEVEAGIAEDWTVEDQSQRFTFQLADATFHNGEPITSQDVKFTMEAIEEATVPLAVDQNYAAIETPDDSTIVLEFDAPNPQFEVAHLPLWGIFPESEWGDVDSIMDYEPDPSNIVGSGMFEVTSFSRDDSAVLEPHDGYPKFDIDHRITLLRRTEKSTRLRQFREGDAAVVSNLTGNDISNLQNQVGEDIVQPGVTNGLGPWQLVTSQPQAPVRYDPFVDAIGAAVDRREINQAVFDGFAEPVFTGMMWTESHPFYPDDDSDIHRYTDQPAGDPEAARAALTDAGWGWDGDGNLRYPEGTDTEPLWPQGETPSPDDFPCIDANGEYQSG